MQYSSLPEIFGPLIFAVRKTHVKLKAKKFSGQHQYHMKLILCLFSLIMVYGCSTTGKSGHFSETGIASYYSSKFNNRKTASGEIFSQKHLTAAHKSLPFGSKVKVTNLENGKTVTVTINDRGPFIDGRIIDLSSRSFQKIGQLQKGLLNVKIERLN